MRRIAVVLAGLFLATAASAAETPEPAAEPPCLFALDFKSDFDNGKLGQAVARMFRMKSAKRKLFTVDTEIDAEERNALLKTPALDADPIPLAKEAKEKLGCDLLVWGAIVRPGPLKPPTVIHHVKEGFSTIVEDDASKRLLFHVRVLDLRKDPPAIVVAETYDCAINFELTDKVDEVLKILTGAPTRLDTEAAKVENRMAPFGAELCPGGDFEAGPLEGKLADALAGWQFPFDSGVTRIAETGPLAKSPGNRCLRYEMDENVAGLTGLFCYSPYIPVKPDAYYQVAFRVKTEGPSVIMFVKGYKDLPIIDPTGMKNAGGETVKTLRQETFKHQIRFYGEKNIWGELVSKPFLPRAAKPEHAPEYLRVQLYAYWPAGVVFFDDVSVRECREIGATP